MAELKCRTCLMISASGRQRLWTTCLSRHNATGRRLGISLQWHTPTRKLRDRPLETSRIGSTERLETRCCTIGKRGCIYRQALFSKAEYEEETRYRHILFVYGERKRKQVIALILLCRSRKSRKQNPSTRLCHS